MNKSIIKCPYCDKEINTINDHLWKNNKTGDTMLVFTCPYCDKFLALK